MFARRTIMPGEPVVIYHGLLVIQWIIFWLKKEQTILKNVKNNKCFASWIKKVHDEKKLYRDNMTAEEKQDAHKNLMSYSDDFSIDIPPRQEFCDSDEFEYP